MVRCVSAFRDRDRDQADRGQGEVGTWARLGWLGAKEAAFALAFRWMDVPKARHGEIKSGGGKGVGHPASHDFAARRAHQFFFFCYGDDDLCKCTIGQYSG